MDSSAFHPDCVDQNTDTVTDDILLKLKDCISKKYGAGNGQPSSEFEELKEIVRNAIAFDHVLWKQKARFKFLGYEALLKSGRNAYKFDANWMTSDVLDAQDEVLVAGENTVRLFIVPALCKWGTSEGDDYSKDVVLYKARVDCLVNGRWHLRWPS